MLAHARKKSQESNNGQLDENRTPNNGVVPIDPLDINGLGPVNPVLSDLANALVTFDLGLNQTY